VASSYDTILRDQDTPVDVSVRYGQVIFQCFQAAARNGITVFIASRSLNQPARLSPRPSLRFKKEAGNYASCGLERC
jgi:hypothetical protein